MVIIPTTLTDGHSQPVAIAGSAGQVPDGQDPDEPPLPRSSSSVVKEVKLDSKEKEKELDVKEFDDIGTASNSAIDVTSQDGWNHGFGGDPDTAHVFSANSVAKLLEVDPKHGLLTSKAKARLERDGANKIDGSGQVSIWEVLLRQVSNSLTIVLLIAMALSYGTLDFIEGAVISAVILLNIVLGLAAPSSQVFRNGALDTVKAESLVIGDIVQLKTGDVVPADLRLFESSNLEVDEALLTGESLAASKNADILLKPDISIGDRVNMVYSATTVTRGRAIGIVVATGMKTQVGSVAQLLRGQVNTQTSTNPFVRYFKKFINGMKSILGLIGTPMQVKLSKFAILLFGLAVLLALIVFSANKWELHNEVVLYGICVAVAVIPESLIAVMTITVAVGVKAMAAGNVVIRRMAALEAIGGVTNICSDKTGTLTQGKMVAHKVWVPGMGTLSVKDTVDFRDPDDGIVEIDGEQLDKLDFGSQGRIGVLRPVLDAIALCNFASVWRVQTPSDISPEKDMEMRGEWKSSGDPTEVALQVLAIRFDRGKESLLRDGNLVQIVEHQFDSSLKRMSMAYKHSVSGRVEVYAKGASESILPILNITSPSLQQKLQLKLEKLASEGLRVLCIASKTVLGNEEHKLGERAFMESGLEFKGLIGLYDPPRIESYEAVMKCHRAGIKVHMLTGDHLSTATAIALKVGILSPSTTTQYSVMAARDFDSLTDEEINALPTLPVVLARCSPTTKVRMVDALSRRKAFSVMTGDGVNDAPALKRAHVGIAMGINGTDVAKDASDMVLTDDNFASIVKAVEEGRRLFDNIQKFLMHLLISNIAQVVLLLIALAFKDKDGNSVFPLSPLEILWVNMITSSFLALGLGMEEAQADIMTRPPRNLHIGVFTWELICDKMLYGTWAGILCLISFVAVVYGKGHGNLGDSCNDGWNEDGSCETVFRARATVFALLSFILLVTAWEVKHFSRSLFNLDPKKFRPGIGIFKALAYNRFLLWAVVAGFLITFPVVYIPVVNKTVFKHRGIGWEWGVVIAGLVLYIAFIESWKAIKRRFGIWSGKVHSQGGSGDVRGMCRREVRGEVNR
ncbi:putative calcium-transporting ATPase 3 [Halenospora varia]|nr:putative calcium-transporting ATPase 3 [Halenospora varia]